MKATMKDYKLADDLFLSGRNVDAIKVLDRMLGIPDGADRDAVAGALEAALADEGDMFTDLDQALVPRPDLGPDAIASSINLNKVRVRGNFVPMLMELRSRAFMGRLESAPTNENLHASFDNAALIVRLFPNHPALLAIAAHPFFLTNDYDTVAALLGRALELDPQNETAWGFLNGVLTTCVRNATNYPDDAGTCIKGATMMEAIAKRVRGAGGAAQSPPPDGAPGPPAAGTAPPAAESSKERSWKFW